MSSYNDIGALSVRLNLETGNFNKKISSINKEIKFLERDFKSAGKGVKNFENTFKGLSDKITKLTKQISLSNTKLSEQKKQMNEYTKALQKQSAKLTELEKVHGKTSTEYKKQSQLVTQIASKMRSLDVAIKSTEGELRDYNKQLTEARSKMAIFGQTTKTFADKLKNVQQESKLTASHFDKMLASLDEGSFKHASAEMDKLSASLQHVKAETQVYSEEIKRLESVQKSLVNTEQRVVAEIKNLESELSQAKAKYGLLSPEVEELNQKLGKLKSTLIETKAKHSENVSAIRDHKTELNKLETQAINTSKRLEAIPTETVARKYANAGSKMMTTGAMLSASIGLPLTMVGKNAVTTAMDFEEGMSRVQAVTGESKDIMAQLEQQARDLGATTQFSATEASEAMSYLGMAGLESKEIMTAMPATLDIAKAGMLDLATTADITTNIMSGFNMTAEDFGHIGDVLAYSASNANTNIEQMGEAMVYLAPIGSTLGLSLEDVSSAVMAVSDAGIQGARAGAAFSTSLVRLTKPTAQMEKVMEKLNISFTEADGSMKPISKIVGELKTKMADYTDAQRASAINTLFGAEATKHWSALLQVGEETLKNNTKALEDCDGTAERMAKTMGDNLAGSVKDMQSKLEEMAITVGYALKPTIEKITKKIGELTEWFANLSPSAQETVIKMGMLAVALPVVTMVAGALASSIGNIVKAFSFLNSGVGKSIGKITGVGKTATTVAKGMSRLTPLLTNPWTLLVGAVAVGGTALYAFKKNADRRFDEITTKARDSITGVGDYLEKELPQKLESATEQINQTEFFSDGTKGMLMGNINALEEAMKSGKENVSREVGSLVSTISKNMEEIPPEMRQSVAEGLADMITALASEGKLTESQFKGFIDELNSHAKINIEVNYDEIQKKSTATLIFNDFAKDMEKVGSKIHSSGNDIQQTIDATVDALSEAKDEDIETFKLLSQGIANHIGSIKMSSDEQSTILQKMARAMAEGFDPQQASALLTELSNSMELGLSDISLIQSAFITTFNENTGSLSTDAARSYADFIKETGNFATMLSGEFGSLSQGNAQFWSDFINRISESKEDTITKSTELVQNMVAELKRTDDPEIQSNLATTMAGFIEKLVTSGKISQEEAGIIVDGINEKLDGVTPEVTTIISADIDKFSENERAILESLGIIDQEQAEAEILANISPAMNKIEEYKQANESTVKQVEGNVAKIDADNSKANKKLEDTKKNSSNTKKSVEKDVAKTDVDNTKATKKLDETKQKSDKTKKDIENKKPKIDVDNKNATSALDAVKTALSNIPAIKRISFVMEGASKITSFVSGLFKKKSIDMPESPEASIPNLANSNIATMYSESINDVATSFAGVSRAMSELDYSGAKYRSSQPVNDTTIFNISDPQMLEAMNVLTSEIKMLNQRQNVVEAQLYIDGKQLKSHMQTIEKRQNRLSGR